MWYIVAVEPAGFLQKYDDEDEVKYKLIGKDGGLPVFDVSESAKGFFYEVYDTDFHAYYLEVFHELNPSGFVYISHTTFLLNWKQGEEELKETLKKVIYRKDKFVAFAISELVASNFLPKEYLNTQIKRS